jgi:hypothetical protein
MQPLAALTSAQALQKPGGGIKRMKLILVSLGSLLLLSSFLSQQFLFEGWNAQSAQIREANADFLAYQSNNHIFNAIVEIVPEERKDRLRQLQLMNYQTALEHLWKEVTPETKASLAVKGVQRIGISAILNARTPDQIKTMSTKVQAQIDNLVKKFRDEQKRIEQNKRKAHLSFSALYIVGSLLILVGNLAPSRKSES